MKYFGTRYHVHSSSFYNYYDFYVYKVREFGLWIPGESQFD